MSRNTSRASASVSRQMMKQFMPRPNESCWPGCSAARMVILSVRCSIRDTTDPPLPSSAQ
jgi:hypothetical protein